MAVCIIVEFSEKFLMLVSWSQKRGCGMFVLIFNGLRFDWGAFGQNVISALLRELGKEELGD